MGLDMRKCVYWASQSSLAVVIALIVFMPGYGQSGRTIRPGESKNGTIAQPGQSDMYTLTVQKAGMYQIDLTGTSQEMDCFLRINGPAVDLEDDDGGGNLNSRLVVQLNPGMYSIYAEGFSGATGGYSLGVRQIQSRPISLGETVRDSISTAGEQDIYMFTIPSPMTVTVSMNAVEGGNPESGGLDCYIELQGSDGLVGEDDDSGGNLNSTLTLDLQPGIYMLICRAFNDSTGPYEVRIIREARGSDTNRDYNGSGDMDGGEEQGKPER